jgi:hypothetical protein
VVVRILGLQVTRNVPRDVPRRISVALAFCIS